MFIDRAGLSRFCQPWLALWAGLVLLWACDYKKSDKELVLRWLVCEECVHGELDAVRARGNSVVPLLKEALKGPSARTSDNVRRQIGAKYDLLQRRASRDGATLPFNRGQYVDHYYGNFKALYQSRAISGLVAIGTDKAKKALKEENDRVQSGASNYRPDVEEELALAAGPNGPTPTMTWASISAGNFRSCGIGTDGKSYCWGRNNLGQLGDGTVSQRNRPTLVAGNLPFTSISAGLPGWHTCGIAGARAYCWGSNVRGELGDGGTSNRSVPTPVAGGLAFVGVVAGGNHACAWTPANRAFCWGGNNAGQVGDGTNDDRRQPVAVASNLGVRSIGVGAFHTCADSTNRELFCWGFNTDGQLGIGAIGDRPTPTQVAVSVRIQALSVGAFHGCVLAEAAPGISAGTAYCVGNNDDGRLGDGSTTGRSSLVPVSGSDRFSSISAGDRHTCAITVGTDQLRCWGDNAYGQLGDNTIDDRTTPVPVSGSLRFKSVSAGSGQTCGVTTDGTAYCWGRNNTGQLGNGTTTDRRTPTPVLAP
jgi:alpha-tubulin suppressor-like RCC1 family protein